MHTKRIYDYGWITVFAGSLLAMQFTVERPDIGHPWTQGFWWMGLLLGLALVSYAALLRRPDDDARHQLLVRLGLLLRLSMLYSLPLLSDDFYRYVWDGRVLVHGANPYQYLPSQWMTHIGVVQSQDWAELYAHLNSKQFYSVYPPLLQGLFAFAAWLSGGDLFRAVVVLKCCVVAAEVASIWLLGKILTRLQLPRIGVLIYALNPLVILELSGNLHTEAFMIVFLLAAIWMLMHEKLLGAALLLTLSIGSKLLPVLIFPFLWRRLTAKQFWIFAGFTALFCFLLFAVMLQQEQLAHFIASLRLYFQYFEFNSGLHNWVKSAAGVDVHRIFSLALPWVMMALILGSAVLERKPDWSSLPTMLLVALTLYQLHSPVVHPWYLTPLVALAALGKYRYAILWTCLIPFTYVAYFYPGIQEQPWLVSLEYVLVFGYIAYEWVFKRPNINLSEWLLHRDWFRGLVMRSIPARLRIKQARIARHLSRDTRILDIGSGHGGLCNALRIEGFDITPVDVKNLSFFPEVVPIVYDGERLPFQDQAFDTSMLITMLHHTPSPSHILQEAKRVTKHRLVIMEDIYRNAVQRELTFFMDSLVNLEFDGHPHTNMDDAGWLALFSSMNMKLVYREDFRTLLFFRQVIYVVEIGE